MIGVYVLLVISILVSIAAVVFAVITSKKKTSDSQVSVLDIKSETSQLQNHMDINDTKLAEAIYSQKEQLKDQQGHFDTFMISMNDKFDKLREDVYKNIVDLKESNSKSLDSVRRDNAEQLEKMRQTVDEKLNETLEKRFNQSFKIVNDRLEEINRTFVELQNLQTGVQDLNKIFKNVKTRGTWGEVSLDNLLSQILNSEQYKKQVQVRKGSQDMVDFAIVMPGKDDDFVYLPIDSKFPLEDYARLQAASEEGDAVAVDEAIKALVNRVKLEAKSIHEKYVNPPFTTDFAIMYLPTEGLYAEIIKRDGLIEELQNKQRVVVCGPTTIAALLNSLQMGFKSLAMEKQSAEISKLMIAFTEDFAKFTKILRQTNDRIDKVKLSIEQAEKRTTIIQKKLGKVTQLSGEEKPELASILDSDDEITFTESELLED